MNARMNRMKLAAVTALVSAGSVAHAAEPICAATQVAPPPAVIKQVYCNQSAISRFFLLSPSLSDLSEAQRAAVLAQPLRYALAYMESDAVNRLKAGFARSAVQSIGLTEFLVGRGKKGEPVSHEMFRLRTTRADT